jgi:dTDP-L-rhamnose 4-epimerase
MSTEKTVLITGGAGFIGSRLAETLCETHRVAVFDSFHPQAHDGNADNRLRLIRNGIATVTGDIRDPAAVDAVMAFCKPDIIYHLAAETGTGQSFDEPARYVDVNVMGTAHLIQAIRTHAPENARVILAGSRSVYGEGACIDATGRPIAAMERRADDLAAGAFQPRSRAGAPLTPVPTNADCPVAPASIYASTKLMQEYLLQQAFWGTDRTVGILRLQNVYGPGQSLSNPYTGVLSIFCRQIQQGQTLDIYEDGQIVRDFVHVDDVVRAFVMMGQAGVMPTEILDIGSGQPSTILDVARRLLHSLDGVPDRLHITGAFRPGDIRHAVADISRAAALLGWAPDIPLDQGLASLARWSRAQIAAGATAAG